MRPVEVYLAWVENGIDEKDELIAVTAGLMTAQAICASRVAQPHGVLGPRVISPSLTWRRTRFAEDAEDRQEWSEAGTIWTDHQGTTVRIELHAVLG